MAAIKTNTWYYDFQSLSQWMIKIIINDRTHRICNILNKIFWKRMKIKIIRKKLKKTNQHEMITISIDVSN